VSKGLGGEIMSLTYQAIYIMVAVGILIICFIIYITNYYKTEQEKEKDELSQNCRDTILKLRIENTKAQDRIKLLERMESKNGNSK
jgi:Na+/H+-translocating membrane pyrophosphatase